MPYALAESEQTRQANAFLQLSYHFLPGTSASNFFSTSEPNHAASLAFSSAVEL